METRTRETRATRRTARSRLRIGTAFAAASVTLCASTPASAQDYNDDGIGDLVIGVPFENPGGVAASAGTVQVIYGSNIGLSATEARTDQIFWQGNAGAQDLPELGDAFGHALASGDFNGDGRQDLAIGVPGENEHAGAVQVFYGALLGGGVGGLDSVNDQFGRNGIEIPGDGLAWDLLGQSLASGDFDGNGMADLAIGAPGHAIGNPAAAGAGAVFLLWGQGNGLTPFLGARVTRIDQGPIGADTPEQDDSFGYALVAGDFDGDGRDDLVVGVPGEGVTVTGSDQGAVHVFFGDPVSGFRDDDRFLTQVDAGGRAEDDDEFGLSLAAGDFDHDSWLDLAVGAPREDLNDDVFVIVGAARMVTVRNAGEVDVFRGSALGLDLDPDLPAKRYTQATGGVPFSPAEDDLFGYALAAGDFRHDNRDCLAIGVPLKDVSGVANAGMVHVLLGGADGLSTADGQYLRQGRHALVNTIEDGDQFGAALSVGHFDGGTNADLAVGAPGEGIGALDGAGAVQVIYGHFGGLDSPTKNELWYQDVPSVEGGSEAGDGFGAAVHGGG